MQSVSDSHQTSLASSFSVTFPLEAEEFKAGSSNVCSTTRTTPCSLSTVTNECSLLGKTVPATAFSVPVRTQVVQCFASLYPLYDLIAYGFVPLNKAKAPFLGPKHTSSSFFVS